MPWSDLVPAPHQPPVRERLGPNQDAHSVISNRHQAWHDDDVHRAVVRAGDTDPRRGHRPDDQSPRSDGPGPWAFGRRI